MGKKRANGEGTVYKLKSGKWKAVVTVGRKPNGRPIRRSKTAESHHAARTHLDALRQLPAHESPRMTVGEYLGKWLADVIEPELGPNTVASFKQQVNLHLIPRLGSLRLSTLKPLQVQSFLAEMLRDGVPSATRSYVYRVLNQALKRAEKLDLIAFNPCDRVDRPAHTKKGIQPFTVDEMRKIIKDREPHSLHAYYVLGFTTGMRQGEMCGLWWEDVDLKRGVLHVRRQLIYGTRERTFAAPKTPHSIRSIEIPEQTVDALESRRKLMLREGLAACRTVFSTRNGTPLSPQVFSTQHWKPLLARLEIPHRGFHHVRHSYATMALGAGVAINVVSHVLGHATPAITLGVYAHALPTHQKQSTEALQKLLG